MAVRSRTYHDCKQFCRSSSICGSFFAMIWCINLLISAVTSLGYVSTYFDEWIAVDALIVGRNVSEHYRNADDDDSQRRHLMSSGTIPNFTADDSLGNQPNFFGNNTTFDGLGGDNIDIPVLDDLLGNTTDTTGSSNSTQGNNSNNNNEDSEDWNNTSNTDATSAPTAAPVGLGGRLVYCAQVQFYLDGNNDDTNQGTAITAVSDTYCSYELEDIVVGHSFGILYNPVVPQEIIEESLYVHAQNTLRLTVGVTVFFTLGYLFCSVYLWRSQPDMSRGIFSQSGLENMQDVNLQNNNDNNQNNPNDMAQTREEREGLMRTNFHFQTVLEDLSNTNAANMRRLCLKGGAEEGGECNHQCSCHGGGSTSKTKRTEGAETQLHDDVELQLNGNDREEEDLELDLTKRDNRDGNSSTANTETETDAGSNNNLSSSGLNESNDTNNEQKHQQQQQQQSLEQESAWSLAGATNFISSWTNNALAPSAPECCICLDTYQPGDKISAAAEQD
ncbi:MAG: hypothetical protein SGBAC_006680 [Bacillariaceae sp.]